MSGCETKFVGIVDGEKVELTEEDYKSLPAEVQAGFAKITQFDKTLIETKIDPVTGAATNILTVTKAFVPEPYQLVIGAIIALLGLFDKAKSVQIARGAKATGQAIEAVKAITDSDIWSKLKPELTSAENKASVGNLLKPKMPDKLL